MRGSCTLSSSKVWRETCPSVNAAEIKQGIRASYDYYFAKLPKKTQAQLLSKSWKKKT